MIVLSKKHLKIINISKPDMIYYPACY